MAVLVDTSSTWGRRIIDGINSFAKQNANWHLYVENRGMDEKLRVPTSWRGDGVIARVSSPRMALELKELGIPVVNVSGIVVPEADFPKVTTDVIAQTQMALNDFWERGFRHFAYFSQRAVSYIAFQRDAFVAAVNARHMDCSVYAITSQAGKEPDWSENIESIATWLGSLPKPVAVLSWNASCARSVIFAAQSLGLMVPEEIAVLSATDDDVLCESTHPPISGIVLDAKKIGFIAAENLECLMRGDKTLKPARCIPPLKIENRQSTDTFALSDPAVVKALSFIRENASKPIQVLDVAREAGLSRRVLEHRFNDLLGRSPGAEIRRTHIERAQRMLQETRHSIAAIAEAAGFCSPEYFATYFKAAVGTTPLEYRRSLSGLNH
ncbi:MAG: DNA-binding transcriptional regulator [Verrucomicrobia bacterium]|nr:DNA-binding transcriptional regulator [Verrucomicrobiota bacterium]